MQAHEDLWRPAPFHDPRPAWCQRFPELTQLLLALSDEAVQRLAADDRALLDRLVPHVPELAALHALLELPRVEAVSEMGVPSRLLNYSRLLSHARFLSHMSGRKQSQITAFAHALGALKQPLLEWCSGKGHLGRWLARQQGVEVCSLEWDAELVGDGRALASRVGIAQKFIEADALNADTARLLAGRHGIALHACGDLHMALLRGAVAQQIPALDLAPCCYYRTVQPVYVPLNPDAGLALTKDELHLAVTETVTSGARERRLSEQAQAWKLAFLELRAKSGVVRTRTFPSVPGHWLSAGFSGWMSRLCGREGVALPADVDWCGLEKTGWHRFAEVRRLELVRLAFRRALELWLILDRAVYLQRNGYVVAVRTFCERSITPRNILISARRRV